MKKRKIAAFLLLSAMLCGMIFSLTGCGDANRNTDGEAIGEYTTLDGLNGKKLASITGSIYDAIVSERLPEAETVSYNLFADQIAALKTGKVDAVISEGPTAIELCNSDSSVLILDEYLCSCDYAAAFAKNRRAENLCAEFNAYLAGARSNGTLDSIYHVWFECDENDRGMEDYAAYPATNGTLHVCTDPSYAPMTYMKGNRIVGYEVDVLAHFCKAYGYALDVKNTKVSGLFAGLETGETDVAFGTVIVTEERRAAMNLSDSYLSTGVVLIVRNANEEKNDFFTEMQAQFEATFLREDRWKLFLVGIGNTLHITFSSLLFGSLLGLAAYLLFRKKIAAINAILKFTSGLVRATPLVVFLMILYYIILAKSPLSESSVAIVGFSITFSCTVFGLLQMGIGAVPAGQEEASLALGFTDTHAFFKILLPQAARHFMPSLRHEMISHLQATAIVGYIAVQDLTKISEMIRSRTLQAFYPLIATALIYIAMEALLSFGVKYFTDKVVFKKHSREDILKGIPEYYEN